MLLARTYVRARVPIYAGSVWKVARGVVGRGKPQGFVEDEDRSSLLLPQMGTVSSMLTGYGNGG